ncbi:uncharacterized protein LOC131429386 [Malaya genurostris]|uniref:uncharacterized protein LOC131429386 n=1 Tax=Malaya genurostris TaxID=325434 RepID=UPI0026F3870E|nr:uncharacterized protein LOC131429386 [Malaya genurostris]
MDTPVPVMINDRDGNLLTDHTSVATRWKEHFERLLNEQSMEENMNRMGIEDDGQAVDPPTLDEIRKAVRHLKNGKAAGKDGIPAELLKVESSVHWQNPLSANTNAFFENKFREYNLRTHHLFIDFKAAYDSVKRNELWQIMLEHGFPTELIRLNRATLDGSKSSVKLGRHPMLS